MSKSVKYKRTQKNRYIFFKRPRAVDIFSGCGGMTEGLIQAGFRVIGAIDVDPLSMETYKLNHPNVFTIKSDIRNVKTKQFMQLLKINKGELDLLAGCPPCQGFSAIRTLNGKKEINDYRNDLIFEFYRFIKDLMPKFIMMENVPGLVTDTRFEVFKRQIELLGYRYKVQVLNAADYGVPQRRKRMILLASLYQNVDFAERDPNRKTVKDTLFDLPLVGQSNDPLHDIVEKRSQKILDLIEKIPRDGGSRKSVGEENQLACHKKCDGFKDIYGRMSWQNVSPTITSGCINPSKGRFLHPEYNRAITLREAALLQSFPRNYKFALSHGKTGVASLIGNALPPEFIRRHSLHISKKFHRR